MTFLLVNYGKLLVTYRHPQEPVNYHGHVPFSLKFRACSVLSGTTPATQLVIYVIRHRMYFIMVLQQYCVPVRINSINSPTKLLAEIFG